MVELVRCVAFVCAPAVSLIARLSDSPDDRWDRANQPDLCRLWRQMQGHHEH